MREKINRLSKGIIDETTPCIKITPEFVNVSVRPGEVFRFDVTVNSSNGYYIKGLAYSDDIRISVAPQAFGGHNVNLVISADCRQLDPEEIVSGEINLVTNTGEYSIPYTLTPMTISADHTILSLNDINDFADIVSSDFELGLRIFEYKNFRMAPFMNKPVNQALHKAFSGRNNKSLAVKQFLLAAGADMNTIGNDVDRDDKLIDIKEHFDSVSDNHDIIPASEERFFTERQLYYEKHMLSYMTLRLRYEISKSSEYSLLDDMLNELGKISDFPDNSEYVTLHRALVYLDKGQRNKTEALLDSVYDTIIDNRQEMLNEYFLYEYITGLMNRKSDKTQSFIRLLKKFISEENRYDLFYYVVNLDDKLVNDSQKFNTFMHEVYSAGCISPFLYLYYSRFINEHPDFLHDPDDFTLHALCFASRYGVADRNICEALAERAGTVNTDKKLYYITMIHMSKRYDNKLFTDAICAVLIKNDIRTVQSHRHFESAIENGSELNGIYEYFMYTCPDDDFYRIPEKVLNHYIDIDLYDPKAKALLFSNVVRFQNAESAIYKAYIGRIKDFTLSQLKARNINRLLAGIYKKIITPEIIDSQNASYVAHMLYSYRIVCNSNFYKSIIVVYPQIDNEQVQMITDNEAYLPIYSDEAVILFQDTYGNRYYDVEYTKTRLIDNPDLLDYVNRYSPDSLPANLQKLTCIAESEDITSSDSSYIKYVIINLPLSNAYRRLLYSKLSKADKTAEFLSELNNMDFTPSERPGYITDLINSGMNNQAYQLIKEFGQRGIDFDPIAAMCSDLIIRKMFYQDEVLLRLSANAAVHDSYDAITLDYLCEHYNGSCLNMYVILNEAIKNSVETYDMEERLLAQMIFCEDNKRIDTVFDWYASRKKASETIVKAYFTLKTADYFLNEAETDSKVFEYLESIVKTTADKTLLPQIYQLALTKHYSQSEALSDEQASYADTFISKLASEGLIFAYYKQLGKYIELPTSVKDSVILEYNSQNKVKPELETRNIPAEREYSKDSFTSVFHNIYLKQFLLFKGERLEYRIYDNSLDNKDLLVKGGIEYSDENRIYTGSRFETLNRIEDLKHSTDINQLHEAMLDYVSVSKINETLFNLL